MVKPTMSVCDASNVVRTETLLMTLATPEAPSVSVALELVTEPAALVAVQE